MKRNLFLPTLISVVSLLALSSIGATYAWYQYQTFVSINMSGTSIDATKVFQVGLISDVELDCSSYNLTYELVDGKNVYWVNGELSTMTTEYYLEMNGYGTKRLQGVTSGKYSTGDEDFLLKRAPVFNDNYVNEDPVFYYSAAKENYLHFDLAFKLNVFTADGSSVATDVTGVKLSSFKFEENGNKINDSVRIHFNDLFEPANNIIVNPTKADDGYDTVGGVLDLFGDHYYDTHSHWFDKYETPYGEYENLVYKDEKTTDGVDYDENCSINNQNCFEADHLNGVYAIDLEKTEWSKSEYLGMKSVVTNNRVLARAQSSGIAYFGMDVYMEGWCQSFTNDVMESVFTCNVGFESI